MSFNNARDARLVLVRDKYFSLRPKPLERWLWQQGLPQAAERVFWLHWEEGMKRGDWCSELSLRQVARECCIDTSTVTRAYQLLRSLNLIQRQDPGRDEKNPFQQAIAVTEVRVPRELVAQLDRAPNRPQQSPTRAIVSPTTSVERRSETSAEESPLVMRASGARLTRAETSALTQKLSATERSAFFTASRDRKATMTFDPASSLTLGEQGRVTLLLSQISGATSSVVHTSIVLTATPLAKARKLSPLEAARLRKRIVQRIPSGGTEMFGQVMWSIEEGALRRFEVGLAINIALKKIREGAWTRPNRMPLHWLRPAVPETCIGA